MIGGGFPAAAASAAVAGVLTGLAAVAGPAAGPPAAPEGRPTPLFSFQDPEITESSGLVAHEGRFLTVNDSGAEPVVYLVDGGSGETVGRTTYAAEVVDVEAVALGPDGSVWVGDIGDNGGRRLSVAVHRLDAVTPGDRTVPATRYDLGYRGGPRDAEALLVHPRTGRLLVVGKGLFGGQVWAAPEELRADRLNELRPVADVGALVTDGAFLPDGRHVVLRSYGAATAYDARSWEPVGSMPLPRQRQGEGLAVSTDGTRLLLSSEGAGSAVLAVPLAEELRAAVSASPPGAPAAEPDPGATQNAPEGTPNAPDDQDAAAASDEGRGAEWWPAVAGSAGAVAAGVAVVVVVGAALAFRAARRRSRPPR